MGLPEGWNDYQRVGKPVHGTRFIAFKVPLKEGMNRGSQVPDEKQLYPKLLVSLVPKLGLVIDLTNTLKYYNPDEFTQLGVEYEKIRVQGHHVPNYECSVQFRDRVKRFLEENEDNDKLIGVHCTHGLNRSGFMICRYMIEEMNTPPIDAITAFEEARSHQMERENYLEKLRNLTAKDGNEEKIPKLPSLAIDTETDKGTQTLRGFWIDEHSIPTSNRSMPSPQTPLDAFNQIQKQVNLIGCVNVQRNDLIPDGRGGYFVHINSKDVKRIDSHPPPNRHRQNFNKRPTHQYPNTHTSAPYNPQQRYNPHQPPPQVPYMQRPRYQGDPLPYSSNYGEEIFRMQTMSGRYNDSLPHGNNNLAEDLLRMQNKRGPPRRSRFDQPF
ncbi:mRNA-capping enzyme [Sitodiplosis mosellana]|uniref:mRNA-capping enzyme n=1 Tax=Sitodiplosis mosellana TaxID=263140 RepID=UPI0024442E5E|nr:mRNA-capping enzyme [Sitodiplosis mosellana]